MWFNRKIGNSRFRSTNQRRKVLTAVVAILTSTAEELTSF